MIRYGAFAEKHDSAVVTCHLCPAECRLTNGKTGICGCRFNKGGELFTNNYGELVTMAIDPIEKKPLYHFYPGSGILSTGPNCCNLGCLHCQNWMISQEKSPTVYFSPEQLVEKALIHKSIGVAFTYTEPMVWYEYIMDVAPLLRGEGLKVVLVTNGYINPDPLKNLIPLTDAMNIDLKGMNPEFYTRICKGKLQPVLDNIERVAKSGVHLELTNLLIPGENDSDDDIQRLIDFVASLSSLIPLHFSAYHPDYKLKKEPTSPQLLLRAKRKADEKLSFVYLGNINTQEGSDTFCPSCKNLLIRRKGFRADPSGVKEGKCLKCGADTGIVQ